ncbi:hypothetical protein CDAR_486121 [Caerostris darwini]|uniref:Uncharacterized protein n=1 Tax=Caerostris darwini TaxID=1538125 RepID=A0AAV4MB68_9ARAC|nr:hypothetical protein CDAR_486121 [Caerostris darwini]
MQSGAPAIQRPHNVGTGRNKCPSVFSPSYPVCGPLQSNAETSCGAFRRYICYAKQQTKTASDETANATNRAANLPGSITQRAWQSVPRTGPLQSNAETSCGALRRYICYAKQQTKTASDETANATNRAANLRGSITQRAWQSVCREQFFGQAALTPSPRVLLNLAYLPCLTALSIRLGINSGKSIHIPSQREVATVND